ncbi:hypothetical protein [Paenibacillus sp. NFR01]|uniref:hypothetical protein n=1 Tax=Paenibacillus sp. NFR01 TaxID=1566279 RepID=UPI0008CD1D3F|nr:hypothetical protein [Paenibacillus sp. NFR01]SEU29978.1 hypothetical protein SAMN03159358_4858 [Paenibacillus sp. NFR01]
MHRTESHDHLLVKAYVLLPLVSSAFAEDAAILARELRTPTPYTDVLHHAAASAAADLREVRADMRKRGVNVYEQRRTDVGVEALFQCRGYHERMLMLDNRIEKETIGLMRKYLQLGIPL